LNEISGNKPVPKRDHEGRRKNQKSQALAQVLKLMSDDSSLLIFKTIFLASGDSSDTLRAQVKLTRKQYYSRISRLTKVGLVNRQKGRYYLTTFGKVVYYAQSLVSIAVKNNWKLKAIDSLGVANDYNMPDEERKKIIDQIISDQQIKEILLLPGF
jgi:DNA-binding HxlR family transcriptional regulator